jgi:ketopantoate reductase
MNILVYGAGVIAANYQIPTVLFMLNNPAGMQRLEVLEPRRVLLGFPSVGGTRQGEVIRYIHIRQQQTTLGEVDGHTTPRLQASQKNLSSDGEVPHRTLWLYRGHVSL